MWIASFLQLIGLISAHKEAGSEILEVNLLAEAGVYSLLLSADGHKTLSSILVSSLHVHLLIILN